MDIIEVVMVGIIIPVIIVAVIGIKMSNKVSTAAAFTSSIVVSIALVVMMFTGGLDYLGIGKDSKNDHFFEKQRMNAVSSVKSNVVESELVRSQAEKYFGDTNFTMDFKDKEDYYELRFGDSVYEAHIKDGSITDVEFIKR